MGKITNIEKKKSSQLPLVYHSFYHYNIKPLRFYTTLCSSIFFPLCKCPVWIGPCKVPQLLLPFLPILLHTYLTTCRKLMICFNNFFAFAILVYVLNFGVILTDYILLNFIISMHAYGKYSLYITIIWVLTKIF